MIRTRLLLALVGLISMAWSFGGFYWANNSHSNDLGVVSVLADFGFVLGPILFLAAILMLVFSFFRVSESSDGRLMYDPANLYWRVLKKSFELDGNISLCKAYWLTALMTFFTVFLTGSVSGILWVVYNGGIQVLIPALVKVMPLVVFLVSLFAPPLIIKTIWPENEFAAKISAYILLCVLAMGFVVFPFYQMMYGEGLTLSASIWKYFSGILEVALIIVPICVVFWAVILLAKYFSLRSGDSLLKRLFTTFKEKMCPILYESSTAGK